MNRTPEAPAAPFMSGSRGTDGRRIGAWERVL